jgi:hypothetical protein
MPELRRYLTITTVTLVLVGAATVAYAQTPSASAPRTPTAPGVSRAIEHPDPTVDQTQPDANQPETAKDDNSGQPETASDAPKTTPQQKAEQEAKRGVRSNTPPPEKPHN